MSVARKCNKCLEFFDPFEEFSQMASFKNPVFRNCIDIRDNHHGEYLFEEAGPDAFIDLCPKCTILFREFMLTGPGRGIPHPPANFTIDQAKTKLEHASNLKWNSKPEPKPDDNAWKKIFDTLTLGGDTDGDK